MKKLNSHAPKQLASCAIGGPLFQATQCCHHGKSTSTNHITYDDVVTSVTFASNGLHQEKTLHTDCTRAAELFVRWRPSLELNNLSRKTSIAFQFQMEALKDMDLAPKMPNLNQPTGNRLQCSSGTCANCSNWTTLGLLPKPITDCCLKSCSS